MTNPIKGEVHFEADGETYTFKLGTNAQVLIETKLGMTMSQFVQKKTEDLGASEIRLIFWAGLHRQHKMSEEAVGDLLDDIGPERAAAIFLEAMQAAAVPRKENGADGEARPPTPAKAPIGMNS